MVTGRDFKPLRIMFSRHSNGSGRVLGRERFARSPRWRSGLRDVPGYSLDSNGYRQRKRDGDCPNGLDRGDRGRQTGRDRGCAPRQR